MHIEVTRRTPYTLVFNDGEISGLTADELVLVEAVLKMVKASYRVVIERGTYENGVRKNTN